MSQFSVTWLSLLYKITRFSIYFLFLSDEGPTLETLDYTIHIDSTPTFLYFVKIKMFFVVVVEFYYAWTVKLDVTVVLVPNILYTTNVDTLSEVQTK